MGPPTMLPTDASSIATWGYEPMNGYRLSADIGGTFTDLVLLSNDGALTVHKTPSTPKDFTLGVVEGVEQILQGAHPQSAALEDVDTFVHGATVVLNALLQYELPVTGLVTTAGFRDVLEIMRTNNPSMYDLTYVKPPPVVPRDLRLEVNERIRHTGEVLEQLNDVDVRRAATRLRAAKVQAVGVCLLHAYANPSHERRVREILKDELPTATICISSDIAPEIREFERASTTCLNAASVPIITSYLERLGAKLETQGLKRQLLVMQSNGGVLTASAACQWPIRTVMSGPSGGVVGAQALAAELQLANVVTIDIGGTSSDMGVITSGRAITVPATTVADGWPILAPMIEIVSIGAGGGSVAWLDAGGALRVGPKSAGADPGPACYGRAGTDPTVTDANLVLGRIDPAFFLGGEMGLDVDAANDAICRHIAAPLRLGVDEAADGIIRIANTTMAKAMRSILIERGYDPREFVMMAFGGGGGLHAASVMRELNVAHTVIPNNPGALSALGMLGTDFRQDRARTLVRPLDELDGAEVAHLYAELIEEAVSAVRADGVPRREITVERSIDARYIGQEYHLNLPLDESLHALGTDVLTDQFHQTHRRVYGYATPEFRVELVGLRVAAFGRTPPVPLPRVEPRRAARQSGPHATLRRVYVPGCGWDEIPIFSVADLCAGDVLPGPSILEDPRSTMLILPRQHGRIDEFRNLHIFEGED